MRCGGLPVHNVMTVRRSKPKTCRIIAVVSDYLKNSTLNHLLDSSDAAADHSDADDAYPAAHRRASSDRIDRLFRELHGVGPYSEAWSRLPIQPLTT